MLARKIFRNIQSVKMAPQRVIALNKVIQPKQMNFNMVNNLVRMQAPIFNKRAFGQSLKPLGPSQRYIDSLY
jgi:hypothetical protein